MTEAKIKKGLGPKRNVRSFQTAREIVIPAGTLLRAISDTEYACAIGFGKGVGAQLTVTVEQGTQVPPEAGKMVIAS